MPQEEKKNRLSGNLNPSLCLASTLIRVPMKITCTVQEKKQCPFHKFLAITEIQPSFRIQFFFEAKHKCLF